MILNVLLRKFLHGILFNIISSYYSIIIYFYIQQFITISKQLFKTIFKRYPNSLSKESRALNNSPTTVYELTDKLEELLFRSIVGYSDIKKLLMRSILSKEQTHILLIGPPATSKTVFLLEMFKELSNAYFIDGTATSGTGMIDFLFTHPDTRFILIDEIDKLTRKDQTVLYNLMETGILIILFYWKLNECYYSKVMLNDKFVG